VKQSSREEQPRVVVEVVSASTESLEVLRSHPARGDPNKETDKFLVDSFNPALQLESLKTEWKGMYVGASSFNEKFEVRLLILVLSFF
jgi:hypothetical protein